MLKKSKSLIFLLLTFLSLLILLNCESTESSVSSDSTSLLLTSLTISSGSLTPQFTSSTQNYQLSVKNDVPSITVTPTKEDENAKISIKINDGNFNEVVSGTPSDSLKLDIGVNNIEILVIAPDSSTNSYFIDVTRAGSNNSLLSALTLSAGSISPSFSSEINSYTVNLPDTVNKVTVTPFKDDSAASIEVRSNNGYYKSVISGNTSDSLSMLTGSNTIDILVTAQDNSTSLYTIKVTRVLSSNALLNSLSISPGDLSPKFSPTINTYSDTLDHTVEGLYVSPRRENPYSTVSIRINGGTYSTIKVNNSSDLLSLNVGVNTVEVKVTAQDSSTNTYTIIVTKRLPNIALLSDLTTSSGVIFPNFSPTRNEYVISVENSVSDLLLTPTADDSAATISLSFNGGNYIPINTGTPSDSLNLNIGLNIVNILVTAQDSTTNTYIIDINRAGSSNATLSNLSISSGALSPKFTPLTNSYVATVENTVKKIVVTPFVDDSNSIIEVKINTEDYISINSGTPSDSLNLIVGANKIYLRVTAQDKSQNIYSINVERAKSSNALISALTPSVGDLTPAFSSTTNKYSMSLPNNTTSLKLVAIKDEPNGRMFISINDGSHFTLISENSSPSLLLNVGINNVIITVEAEDGTINSYFIDISRAGSSNADLSGLTVSKGVLSPEFTSSETSYTVPLNNSNKEISVTPTKEHSKAQIEISINEGSYASITSGTSSPLFDLNVGDNEINVRVTAEDGSIKTYTIVITRAGSSNAALSALALSSGTLTPDFASVTTVYSVSVGDTVTGIIVTPTKDDSAASIAVRINGENYKTIESGSNSDSLDLNIGDNSIEIQVTAQDSTIRIYTVNVSRSALTAPTNVSASKNDTSKIVITWNSINSADKYFIYRSLTVDGTFDQIGNTETSSFEDLSGNQTVVYFYKLKSWSSVSDSSDFSETASGYMNLSSPTNVDASLGLYDNKITITWDGVSKADNYELYRSELPTSGFSLVETTTSTSFTDTLINHHTSIDAGQIYYYHIKACTDNGVKSESSEADSGYCDLTDPDTTNASYGNVGKIVDIHFTEINGATDYYFYRSTEKNGTYAEIGRSLSSPYKDFTVDFETKYFYKMRAYASSADIYTEYSVIDSGYCYFGSPSRLTVTSDTTSVNFSWRPIKGVSRYYVYRATSQSGPFSELGFVNDTFYVDRNADHGTGYYYKSVSWDADMGLDSDPFVPHSISNEVFLRYPTPEDLGASEGCLSKIHLKWKAVPGGDKYRIYRSSSSTGSFTTLTTTTDTTYTDNSTGIYYYKVAAYTGGYSTAISDQSATATGSTGITLNSPDMVTATQGTYTNRIEISWNSVADAARYNIYKSTTLNGTYTKLNVSTSATSYTEYVSGKSTFYYKITSVDLGLNESGLSIYGKGWTD